ncbi:MAG: beta-lactamase class A-like protein beta-lactamase [Candidatus Taylorbacteria bacterium]|nr:beta-lactamase class A-like protein beta-lactamase [Candidatus Taylorbacteria bacterium]
MKKVKKGHYLIACIGTLVLGSFVGWYGRVWYASTLPSKLVEIRENSGAYNLINPLLLVDSNRQAPDLDWMKKTISDSINSNKDAALSVSVYFRDLNAGKWTGVNEDGIYDPSSMMKVAVMMGYLKKADSDPSILTKNLDYKYMLDSGQNYQPEHPLSNGPHTVAEIIQSMIIGSDNTAMEVLYNNDRDAFVNVLKELNIPPPATIDDLDFISPKSYSAIFRTLYSSTYLSRTLSEKALELLTLPEFKNGLVAGVPKDIVVAHKFGEHTTLINGAYDSRQLHDCGIIYYPGNPYLLCVMTKGQDFDKEASVIAGISKDVYNAEVLYNPLKK